MSSEADGFPELYVNAFIELFDVVSPSRVNGMQLLCKVENFPILMT